MEKRLVEELYESPKLYNQTKREKLIAGIASLGTSIAAGIIETDFISPFYNTTDPTYQFAISIALPLISYGISKVACHLYKKLKKGEKPSGTSISLASLAPIVYTNFDTAAALRGYTKGHEIGYLGKVNKESIFKGPVSEVMLSEVKVGNFKLPVSIAHSIGFGLTIGYFIDSIKPIKPIEKIKGIGHKISEFASKSRLHKYALELSLGSLLAFFSGLPHLAATPIACDVTREYGEIAIEKAKAKAESFFSQLRKFQLT